MERELRPVAFSTPISGRPFGHLRDPILRCIVRVFSIFLVAVLLPTSAVAGFDEGHQAYEAKDYETAMRELLPEAEADNVEAQYLIGHMYYKGRGVDEDYEKAVVWYRRAAELGHAPAQYRLGNRYAKGQGVDESDEEALKWYRQAADQCYAKAMKHMAKHYFEGLAVEQDPVQAYAWISLAARFGDTDAKEHRADAADEMEPADVTRGEDLAAEWLSANDRPKCAASLKD